MSNFDLSGKSALITGSTQGVGRAIALGLARAGADITLHGLYNDNSAQQTFADCKALGVNVNFFAGDLSNDRDSVIALAEQIVAQDPAIDLLVNNAGGYFDVPFLEMDFEIFEKTMRLNVGAYFLLTQFFARRWVSQNTPGRVLMIGSINGRLAEDTHVAYDTSKGAVEMMVRSVCVELAPHGIRVNGLAPGLFRTPLTAPALDDPKLDNWMKLHTPNGSVPGPEVAADAAVFLLSDAAKHIHGQMLLVDGGMSVWQQPSPP